MNANICNFLRVFHTFLYKIGGHVYRHFVVKPRAYCRLVTGIVGDENEKTHLQLCKRYLEVSNKASNVASKAELDRFPLIIAINQKIMNYFT